MKKVLCSFIIVAVATIGIGVASAKTTNHIVMEPVLITVEKSGFKFEIGEEVFYDMNEVHIVGNRNFAVIEAVEEFNSTSGI